MVKGLGFAFLIWSSYALGADSSTAALFDDKPYTVDLAAIQKQDKQPLELDRFDPEGTPDARIKGLRIISEGREFTYVYEVINIANVGSDVLDQVSKSLDGHEDVLLKQFVSCRFGDRCLHYFQRRTVGGKPNHVSSNYIISKGGNLVHFAASSYAPAESHADSWTGDGSDENAEREVKVLMDAASLK